MAEDATPFKTAKDSRDLLKWDDKRRFQQLFASQAVDSFIYLCIGMSLFSLLLPILLVWAGGYSGHYSISTFYHVSGVTRNIMVGILFAEGVFLGLFHGLSKLENWI